MVRKFKVLRNIYGRVGYYPSILLMREGETVDVKVLENDLYTYKGWRFHSSWLDSLLETKYLEEILPDEKPNLSDRISTEEFANNLKQMNDALNGKSENPYGRKIYLAEAFHACRNHDLCIKDSNGVIWELNGKDFYSNGVDGCPRSLSIFYPLEDLIMGTFEVVVKPVEEVKEKWIKVQTNSELCSCIIKGKTIKAQGFVYKPEDLKASVLIDAIFDEIKSDGVWYLEE